MAISSFGNTHAQVDSAQMLARVGVTCPFCMPGWSSTDGSNACPGDCKFKQFFELAHLLHEVTKSSLLLLLPLLPLDCCC